MNTSIFTTDLKEYFNRIKLQESYASIVLGAIVVIILGLLIANYFTKGSGQIGTGVATTQEVSQITPPNRVYKVASGDSLSKISNEFYGDMQYWPVLARVNNISNPDAIYLDTQLKVPAKAEVLKMRADMTMTSYQVQNGDTLFIIAQKAYGDGSRWQEIANANNVSYLQNGNPLIFSGSNLTIPR